MATLLTEDQLSKLSVEERMKLIQMIWDSLKEDEVPVPPWHEKILEQRLKRMEEDPHPGIPWSEVKEQLRKQREGHAGD